jgi:hypothetical protein
MYFLRNGHVILGFLGALSKESGDVVLLKPGCGDPLAIVERGWRCTLPIRTSQGPQDGRAPSLGWLTMGPQCQS